MEKEFQIDESAVMKVPKELENHPDPFIDPELQEVDPGTPIENEATNPEVERALASGWTPKEDWVDAGKDPNQWREAREFNDRGELMAHIKRSNDEVSKLKRTVETFRELNENIVKSDKAALTAKIKEELAAAIEEGRGGDAVELTEKLNETKQIDDSSTTPVEAPPPEFNQFIQDNPWYLKDGEEPAAQHDPKLTAVTNQLAAAFVTEEAYRTGVAPDPGAIVNHIATQLQEKFPDRFGGAAPTRTARTATSLEPAGDTVISKPKPKSNGKYGNVTLQNLPSDVREVIKTMAEGESYTEQEYLDMMIASGTLELD